MISYEQAITDILKNTHLLADQQVLLCDSLGRILREDIISGIEMPPFDRSAMDGYALNSADLKKIPAKLRCIGLIQAGDSFKKRLKRGECVKIMTGAPIPEGADCVVMVEFTKASGKEVTILKAIQKWENIFFKGEDFKKGQCVLKKGVKISASHVAILAAVGRKYVMVSPKPQVAVLNTGGEIIPLGVKLSKNQIYNSNGPILEALLKSDHIQPIALGIARDNIKDLTCAIKNGLGADVLLISGGVSMGDYDLVPDALNSLGVKKIFHKVNIKPGKPLFFGIKGKTIVFGIPGNPVSNFLSYLIFTRPAIRKMMGYLNYNTEFKEGIIEKEFRAKSGRRNFVLVKILKKAGLYYLSPVAGRSSADTLSLSCADGFMMLDDGVAVMKKKSKIRFITWKTIW
ncbi:MAG: molybdopterin molybdotransferase MoeA [Candidatus Omnitrophota bacterium]|nr:molybdopterin molybdotransferase MoeA [Candidatus Omnitrophota bacterium]